MTPATTTGSITEVVRLRPGVYRAVDRRGSEYLLHRLASQSLGKLSEPQRTLLHQLAEADCAVMTLQLDAYNRAGDTVMAELVSLLDRLRTGGWLHVTVLYADQAAYTVLPYRFPTQPPPLNGSVLSRFAVMRREGEHLLLESPRSWCAVRMHQPQVAAAVAAHFGGAEVDRPTGYLPVPLAERLHADMVRAELLVPVPTGEDTEFVLRQWSPHELWFHHRSRGDGPADGHFGRTRWAAGHFDPLPARRLDAAGPVIDLDRPDLGALQHTDATVTEVLERRRSIRQHDDDQPINLGQISEFLFRAAGIRRIVANDGVDYVTGPNPSGGALDPLEFYIAVRLAEGLEPGLYRYNRFDHLLELVSGPTRPVSRLIEAAQAATGASAVVEGTYPPQTVVLLAARFGRVGWSYETLAHSLILKQVGVAYQTMYLVATAMGLAPCALGAGDPAAFAAATGLDPLREATVGEFILGSRPADSVGGSDQLEPT